MELIFASQNLNKAKEIQALLPATIRVKTLQDIACFDDIPETALTLEGNALLKAKYVSEHYALNCFADDTGLEIEALNNEPGVFSARYAGENKDSNDNMDLVLKKLKGKENRKARFRTVIVLLLNGQTIRFEGCVEGQITLQKSGIEGFGYDPIFQANGYDRTFSEMTVDEKNKISHRGIALRKLINYLATIQG